MKTCCLAIALTVVAYVSSAQRLVPVFPDPDSLHLSRQMPDELGQKWVNDICTINGELVVLASPMEAGNSAYRIVGNELVHMDDFNYTDADVTIPSKFVQTGGMTFVCGSRFSDFEGPTTVKVHNGEEWIQMGSVVGTRIYDVVEFNGTFLLAREGYALNSGILQWNGVEWLPFTSPIFGRVHALEVYNGVLYAGGDFEISSEIQYLAKLGPNGWEEVGNGVNNRVLDLHSTGGLLYICGQFTADASETQDLPRLFAMANALVAIPDWVWEIDAMSPISLTRIYSDNAALHICSSTVSMPWNVDRSWSVENNEVYFSHDHQAIRVLTHNGIKYFVNSRLNHGEHDKVMYGETPLLREVPEGQLQHTLSNGHFWAQMTTSPTQLSRPSLRPGFTTEPWHSPKDNVRGLLYTVGFWAAGKSDGNPYGIDSHYLYNSNLGVPRSSTYGPYSECYNDDYLNRYFRIWPLSREMIEFHQQNFNSSGYNIPEVILNYPGNGRTWCNESSVLAPFVDLNGNGIYEPLQGDYPEIRGDQSVVILMNEGMLGDNGAPGTEAVVEYYLFDTPDLDLGNTLFVHANIRNRSGRDYEDFAIGFLADFDIGFNSDDFVGCAPESNYFYGYNGDDFDEPSFTTPGYGNNIPACGVLFLNRPLDAFRYYNQSSSGLNGRPTNPQEVSNILQGLYTDGTPMEFGGYPGGSWDPDSIVTHQYSDLPWEPFPAWNETTSGHVPSGRRGVGSTFIGDFPDRSAVCIDLAIVLAFPADSMIMYNEVEQLDARIMAVKSFYDEQSTSCFWEDVPLAIDEVEDNFQMSVFPNPNGGQFTIAHDNLIPLQWNLFSLAGRLVASGTAFGQNEVISLEHLSEGFYLFVASDAEGPQRVEKIIIRR